MKKLGRNAFNLAANLLRFGNEPVLIAGHGRSGTTWIGHVFCQAPGVLYYHEPCAPREKLVGSFATWFKYVIPTQRDSELESCLDPVFKGLVPEWGRPWPRNRLPRRLLPGFRVVVKEVASLMCLAWVCHRYNPRVLLVVRHPCGVALSEFRKRTPVPESVRALLRQPALVKNHLSPYQSVLEGAKEPFEIFGAVWAARYRVVVDQMTAHPDWTLVTYEDLCEDPQDGFADLFERFGLQWTSRVEDFLRETTTRYRPGTYSIHRVAAEQARKWRKEMTSAEIGQVHRFVEPFRLPFYSSESDWR